MPPRTGLTEAEKEIERAKAKKRWLLKQRGQGGIVNAAEMQERIRLLHDTHQVTFERISERTGIDLSSIKWHYYGKSTTRPTRDMTTCQWRVHNAVMSAKFGPADVSEMVRSVGTQRRLRALVAAGFSQVWLAENTGRSHAELNNFMVRDRKTVLRQHATEVEQLYRKVSGSDPVELGVPEKAVKYSKTVARKRGYEPSLCWDDDTIDDPDAIPEWTGMCGTEDGYRIHIRETLFGDSEMPPCDACRDEVETRELSEEGPIFLRERFAEMVELRGVSIRKIAEDGYGDVNKRDTLYRWREGSRSPRTMGDVERLAAVLDCDVDFLIDREAMKLEASKPVVGHGQFNPYILKVMLDVAGMSYQQAAKVGEDFSVGAVSKWVQGAMKPSDRKKLGKLAAHFNVSVDLFYS